MKRLILLMITSFLGMAVIAQDQNFNIAANNDLRASDIIGALGAADCGSLSSPCNINITGNVRFNRNETLNLIPYKYVRFIIKDGVTFNFSANNAIIHFSQLSILVIEGAGVITETVSGTNTRDRIFFDSNNDGVITSADTQYLDSDVPTIQAAGGADAGGPCSPLNCTVSPLPVLLINWAIKPLGTEIQANWSTASELNNDYFTIEESVNGFDYQPVTQVKGAGTTLQQQNYSHTFRPLNKGSQVLYYRLKQTDFDGTYAYSHIVSIGGLSNETKMSVYPNPVKEGQFYLTNPNMVVRQVKVVDLSGKVIVNKVYREENTSYLLRLSMPKVTPGIFQVLLIGDTRIESKMVMVGD